MQPKSITLLVEDLNVVATLGPISKALNLSGHADALNSPIVILKSPKQSIGSPNFFSKLEFGAVCFFFR